LSASFLAIAARCFEARTELPKSRSRDLVQMGQEDALRQEMSATRYNM